MIETEVQLQAPTTFPRTYRPSIGWRVFLLFFCVVLGVPSAVGIWYFGTGHETRGTHGAIMLICVCLALLLLSVGLAAYLFVSRVTLWPNRIEIRDLIRTRTLHFTDIEGRRIVNAQTASANFVLVPRHRGHKQVQIAKMYNFDEAFYEWFGDLPDLDERDLRKAEEEIANNAEIGATPDERIEALKRGKRLSGVFSVATVALAAWAWIYPAPYNTLMWVLVALPWIAIAIVARSAGLFKLDGKQNDPHPNLGLPFMMPGFVLALRVLFDINILGWKEPLSLSIVVSLLLTAAAVAADRSLRNRFGMALLIFVLSIAYGFGLSMQANALLDRSLRTIYRTQIIEKRVSHGRHTSYDLYLEAWGPKDERDRVSVPHRFYDSVNPGDSVCVLLRQGAFHVEWYTVQPCR